MADVDVNTIIAESLVDQVLENILLFDGQDVQSSNTIYFRALNMCSGLLEFQLLNCQWQCKRLD